jgi:3-methyladenine DNA glycosylase AlkD
MKKETRTVIENLLLTFQKNADAYQAERMKAYMRNLFDFYGLQKDKRAVLASPFLNALVNSSEESIDEVVKFLWKQPQRECQYVAMEYIFKMHKKWTPATLSLFEFMIAEKSWWDTVDFIASSLVGKLLEKYPELILSSVERWDADKSFWFHRTTMIFQLKYAAKTDQYLLFAQCEKYVHSKEFFIQKALGWSLRQYSKFNADAVRNFVDAHQLSTVSLREAKKYL